MFYFDTGYLIQYIFLTYLYDNHHLISHSLLVSSLSDIVIIAHPDFKNYNRVLHYRNIDFSIIQMVKRVVLGSDPENNSFFKEFSDILKTHFLANYTRNNAIIDQCIQKEECKNGTFRVDIYNITRNFDYDILNLKLQDLYVNLQKINNIHKN